MGSMNISIKDEAYAFLESLKSENKSFSDVILEFKERDLERGKEKGILKFFGVLKDSNWTEKEEIIRDFRESFEKRVKETAGKVGESMR